MKEQFSHLVKSAASNIFSRFFAFRATRVKDFAPCKGIQDSLGFWIPCCGFRIPGTGFRIQAQWIPDSRKSWSPLFFPGFNTFLRTSFSCSNLAILKDVIRRHNKFVFFFDLQNYGKKCITVPKGFMV